MKTLAAICIVKDKAFYLTPSINFLAELSHRSLVGKANCIPLLLSFCVLS